MRGLVRVELADHATVKAAQIILHSALTVESQEVDISAHSGGLVRGRPDALGYCSWWVLCCGVRGRTELSSPLLNGVAHVEFVVAVGSGAAAPALY